MQTVKVGRYDEGSESGGWIEPEDSSWVIFLDKNGRPASYYMARDSNEGVIEESEVDLEDLYRDWLSGEYGKRLEWREARHDVVPFFEALGVDPHAVVAGEFELYGFASGTRTIKYNKFKLTDNGTRLMDPNTGYARETGWADIPESVEVPWNALQAMGCTFEP